MRIVTSIGPSRIPHIQTCINSWLERGCEVTAVQSVGESELLKGATETIRRTRPVIMAEVNAGALERAGASRTELLDQLECLGYGVQMIDTRLDWNDTQYEVICLPE